MSYTIVILVLEDGGWEQGKFQFLKSYQRSLIHALTHLEADLTKLDRLDNSLTHFS
jgi:hypothetical protein